MSIMCPFPFSININVKIVQNNILLVAWKKKKSSNYHINHN